MAPSLLPMQPTAYIQNSWKGREYGKLAAIEVASVHDGRTWALHATWEGVSAAGKDFPDALAIALPVRGEPALILMGAENAPIHFLRWQANKPEVSSQMATGIGKSTKSVEGPELSCQALAVNDGNRWNVVVARALGQGGDVAPLLAGAQTRIGFAVWRGDNDERGGIKAFSINWADLVLDA